MKYGLLSDMFWPWVMRVSGTLWGFTLRCLIRKTDSTVRASSPISRFSPFLSVIYNAKYTIDQMHFVISHGMTSVGMALNKHITQQCKHVPSYHCLFFYFSQGVKKSGGPCGGRDCSGGCQCFPEKGARVSFIVLAHPSIFIHPMPLWWIYSLPFMHNAKHRISGNVSRNILICVLISQFHARNKIQYYNG